MIYLCLLPSSIRWTSACVGFGVFRLWLTVLMVLGGCEFVTWVGSTLTIACYGLVFRCLGCVGFGC